MDKTAMCFIIESIIIVIAKFHCNKCSKCCIVGSKLIKI